MGRRSKEQLQAEFNASIAELGRQGVGYDCETDVYFKLPLGGNNAIFTAFLRAMDDEYGMEEIDISAYDYLEAEEVAMVVINSGIFAPVKLDGLERRVGYYF